MPKQGPLAGLRLVEFAGLGPAPLAGQLLADLGAEVIVIDRKVAPADANDINRRGKSSVVLNLKSEEGRQAALALIGTADALIEGFRPGVMERLALGPEDCPDTLVYGRMTGWGQEGPLADRAGHDITYLATTGVLDMLGPADGPPAPPINLVADYGGGTMFLVFGLLAALFERQVSGKGQVVDAAMVDGVPAMMGLIYSFKSRGQWSDKRGENLLDGGAPFYRCYVCACGGAIAVGALEPQFYSELIEGLGLDPELCATQMDQALWPEVTETFKKVFAARSRDEWAAHFDGTDACVAPVLRHDEAPDFPHNAARGTFFQAGPWQAFPAPRFGRTTPDAPVPPRSFGADTERLLGELGYAPEEIAALKQAGDAG